MPLPICKCQASAIWILQLYLKNEFEVQQNCNIRYVSRHIVQQFCFITPSAWISSCIDCAGFLFISSWSPKDIDCIQPPTHPLTHTHTHTHTHTLCIRVSYLPWQPVLLWKWTDIREFKLTYVNKWEWKTALINSIIYMSQCPVHHSFLLVFYFFSTSIFCL